MFQEIIEIVIKHRQGFFSGIAVTLKLCILVWSIGISLGSLTGMLSSKWKVFNIFTKTFSFVLSGVPVLVFLFWLHYPAQYYLGIQINPFYTAVLLLAILNTFAVSEIVNVGINNLPKQYIEVARVCNINARRRFLKIEFPLIFRHILPSLLTTQVNMLQLTLFTSLISVEEIFRVSQRVISIEYKPVEIYSALGIFFLIICLPVNGLALFLKSKFTRNIDEK